jgi:polygalacturonase
VANGSNGRSTLVWNGTDRTSSRSERTVRTRYWLLTSALELPSHTTLRLEGATLRLADGATDNLLRNADYDDGNEDIHVVGVGRARLDGNGENQERITDGSHETVGIHLYNVENVTLSCFSIGPTENWAIAPENVVDLTVSNVDFAQDGKKTEPERIARDRPGRTHNGHEPYGDVR